MHANYPHRGFSSFVRHQLQQTKENRKPAISRDNVHPTNLLDEARKKNFEWCQRTHKRLEELASLKPEQTEVWPESYSKQVTTEASRWVKWWCVGEKGDKPFYDAAIRTNPPSPRDQSGSRYYFQSADFDWNYFWFRTETTVDIENFVINYMYRMTVLRCALYLCKQIDWKAELARNNEKGKEPEEPSQEMPMLEAWPDEIPASRKRKAEEMEADDEVMTSSYDSNDSDQLTEEGDNVWSLSSDEEYTQSEEETSPPVKRIRQD